MASASGYRCVRRKSAAIVYSAKRVSSNADLFADEAPARAPALGRGVPLCSRAAQSLLDDIGFAPVKSCFVRW